MKTRSRRRAITNDPIKVSTIATLSRVIQPLIELMLDTGITVHELNKLIRERAVRVAMKRLISAGEKESKSRAAIMTGLSRSEVANLLRSEQPIAPAKSDQLPAKRILAAWHDDPRFSGANKNPAVLPIFGRAASFEQLVDKYGGGIPVRAMLDELTQLQAIERLPEQRVKIRGLAPVLSGLTPNSIEVLGDRAHDLLQTLTHNCRQPIQPLFEETATSDGATSEMISFARDEIAKQGSEFINKARALLNRSELKKNAKNSIESRKRRIGVTIFYFEDGVDIEASIVSDSARSRRKNLRRESGKAAPHNIPAK